MKTVTEPLLERTHPSRMTEIELVDACLDENRLAQKELYDRYKQAMYTLSQCTFYQIFFLWVT